MDYGGVIVLFSIIVIGIGYDLFVIFNVIDDFFCIIRLGCLWKYFFVEIDIWVVIFEVKGLISV